MKKWEKLICCRCQIAFKVRPALVERSIKKRISLYCPLGHLNAVMKIDPHSQVVKESTIYR